MTKDNKQAEDVAAVLAGRKSCYCCEGTGKKWFTIHQNPPKSGYFGECPVCKGKRWLKPSKTTVLRHADGIVGSTGFVDD